MHYSLDALAIFTALQTRFSCFIKFQNVYLLCQNYSRIVSMTMFLVNVVVVLNLKRLYLKYLAFSLNLDLLK